VLQPAKTSPGNPAEPLIHIVDDDDTVRRLLTILMEKEGFRVVAHRNGLTALEQSPALQPELVMLDVAMPGMDGITLCRHLRQLDAYRQVPILMLTGLSDDGTVAAAYAAGATDYIPKPLRPEVLRHKVSHLLHSHHIARQLRETENKLRSIVQYANDAILVLDAALHVLELNPKAELLLGAGVVGNMIGELLDTEESLDTLLPHLTRTGRSIGAAVRNRDGRTASVELTSSDFYLGTHRRYVLILRNITGRKPSEKTLEVPSDLPDSLTAVPSQGRGPSEPEPETSDILDALPLGLARLNRRGQIIFINRRLTDMLGERPSRCLGASGRRYVSRLGWKEYKPALRRFLSHRPLSIAAGEPVVLTRSLVLRKTDGCFFPVILSLMPVAGKDGWLVLVEDRTRHQTLEDRLRYLNEEWVVAVDALPDMILLEDRMGRIRRCNRAVAEFLQRPYSAIIGQSSAALFWGATEGSLATCVQHPAAFQFPTSDRWFRMNSYWIDQERGIGTGWVHIITDITSQRRSELERGKLIRAIEQVGEAVVTFDRHGRVQFCNPAFEQLTGIRSWEAVGHSLHRLGFGPVDRAVRRDILRQLVRGKGWCGRYLARRRDGSTYPQQATISPVRDAQGQLQNVVVVCRDVTEQLRYEAIAEAVNVMENASHIFSAIRHEMGNPINSIKTALTVLRQAQPLSSEAVTTYVERCLSEIGRVEYLLRALRSFSLYETPELQAQPLLPFLERFCALVKDDLSAQGVDFQPRLASDLGWVNFDARALHQALMNLISNAVDALSSVPEPQVILTARCHRRLIVIEVRDNGPGIEPKHLDHIFKPFYTTKPQGTGLGLVIARKLLSRMRGTVELQSPPAGGCVAIVTLEALPEDDG
jgi:PAS domain S-box-containing protein